VDQSRGGKLSPTDLKVQADFQDGRYLAPIVEQVAKEDKEREMWDNVTVERRK
jgi:hypothetical protein